MTKLILDLDLTVFCIERDLPRLHPSHKLSPISHARIGNKNINIRIINPDKLSKLINTVKWAKKSN